MSSTQSRPYENLFSQFTTKTQTPWAKLDIEFKGIEPELYEKIMAGFKSGNPYEQDGYTYKVSYSQQYNSYSVFQNTTHTQAHATPKKPWVQRPEPSPSQQTINMSEDVVKKEKIAYGLPPLDISNELAEIKTKLDDELTNINANLKVTNSKLDALTLGVKAIMRHLGIDPSV